MRAQVYNYTIREGSMEAKTEDEGAAESTAIGRPEATGRPTLYSARMTDVHRTSEETTPGPARRSTTTG